MRSNEHRMRWKRNNEREETDWSDLGRGRERNRGKQLRTDFCHRRSHNSVTATVHQLSGLFVKPIMSHVPSSIPW